MKKASIHIQPDTSDGTKAEILLEGELTLVNAEEIKVELLSAIEQYNQLTIKIMAVTNIDLSCIQLFISLRKTMAKLKKNLSFELNLSDDIKTLIQNSGFDLNEL